jgi:hypothetical protein
LSALGALSLSIVVEYYEDPTGSGTGMSWVECGLVVATVDDVKGTDKADACVLLHPQRIH